LVSFFPAFVKMNIFLINAELVEKYQGLIFLLKETEFADYFTGGEILLSTEKYEVLDR
jgi:hypothetical protein